MPQADSKTRFIDTGSHLRFKAGPVVLTHQTEMRQQLLGVARAATKQLTLWTCQLDDGLFEHPGFIELVKRFVLAHRHAQVRLMLGRIPDGYGLRHPLLALAERLPGSFDVRTVLQPTLDAAELLVADQTAVLYRIHIGRWDGVSNLHDEAVARFYLAQFAAGWRDAPPLMLLPDTYGL